MPDEPFAARLHFLALAGRDLQNLLVRALRRYFERAPGWVLLTTTGRKSGLPREVLLPCERTPEGLVVVSTYAWRSHWIRNLAQNPRVLVTAGGWLVEGSAEVVEEVGRKAAIARAHPFFPAAPFAPVHAVLRTLLRPLLAAFLVRWVTPRPIVLIRPRAILSPRPADPAPDSSASAV